MCVCVCLSPKKTQTHKQSLRKSSETPLELPKNVCVYILCLFFGLPTYDGFQKLKVHFWEGPVDIKQPYRNRVAQPDATKSVCAYIGVPLPI